MTPAEAELNALLVARDCEFYGIRLNSVLDHNGVVFNLAVGHPGILIFLNNTRQSILAWPRIRKLSFKRKKFIIKLHQEVCKYTIRPVCLSEEESNHSISLYLAA